MLGGIKDSQLGLMRGAGDITTTYESERSSVFNENLQSHEQVARNKTSYQQPHQMEDVSGKENLELTTKRNEQS